MKNYKISIIVPVYNAQDYLKKCLDSLINQTYENIEIIAVNDASTDDSLAILYDYEKSYSNFKVINLEKNHRQGGARNIGIQHSTGDYISFIDSDDWIEFDTYERFNNILICENADLICSCSYIREYNSGKTEIISDTDGNFLKKISNHLLSTEEKEQLLFKGSGVTLNIYRSSIIKDNDIKFPEGLSYEDNFFVPLLFAYVNKVSFTEKPFYHYRENLNSTLFKANNTQLDRIKIEKMRYETFCDRNLLDKYYAGYEILTLNLFYLITLGTFYKFFKEDFINLSRDLKEDFYKAFPNFKKNKYYKSEISFVNKIKVNAMEISPYVLLFFFNLRDIKSRYKK